MPPKATKKTPAPDEDVEATPGTPKSLQALTYKIGKKKVIMPETAGVSPENSVDLAGWAIKAALDGSYKDVQSILLKSGGVSLCTCLYISIHV